MNRWTLFSAVIGLPLLMAQTQADTLSVDDYAQQVAKQNPSYEQAQLNAQAAALSDSQSDFEYATRIFSNAQYGQDRSPKQNTAFSGETSSKTDFSIGVQKKTRSGLQGKLSYNTQYFDIKKASRNFVPNEQYYDNFVQLELSQSLWKNGLGKESQLKEAAQKAQSKANEYQAKFALKQLDTQARQTYYNLAIMQKVLKAQTQSVARARSIYQYNSRRAANYLADRSDVLRTKAAYQLRNLELQSTKDQMAVLALQFNALKGKRDNEVNETLSAPSVKEVLALSIPEAAPSRLDTQASMMRRQAALSQNKAGSEVFKPELELYGQLKAGGLDKDANKAISESFSSDHISSVVGVRFVYPLGSNAINNLNASLSKQAEASRFEYKQAQLEEKVLWSRLSNQLSAAQAQLKLAQSLERAQYSKLINEKRERKRGRSTIFQVLLAEQDYISAQINTLQLINHALSIYAQINLYGEQ